MLEIGIFLEKRTDIAMNLLIHRTLERCVAGVLVNRKILPQYLACYGDNRIVVEEVGTIQWWLKGQCDVVPTRSAVWVAPMLGDIIAQDRCKGFVASLNSGFGKLVSQDTETLYQNLLRFFLNIH